MKTLKTIITDIKNASEEYKDCSDLECIDDLFETFYNILICEGQQIKFIDIITDDTRFCILKEAVSDKQKKILERWFGDINFPENFTPYEGKIEDLENGISCVAGSGYTYTCNFTLIDELPS